LPQTRGATTAPPTPPAQGRRKNWFQKHIWDYKK
jgi:hypothetical protein